MQQKWNVNSSYLAAEDNFSYVEVEVEVVMQYCWSGKCLVVSEETEMHLKFHGLYTEKS